MSEHELQRKFWSIITALLVLPISKSALYNTSTLFKEFIHNLKLKQEKRFLEEDKLLLQTKIKEFNSQSGLKRAIKEEINLVETNEIIVKII